MLMKKIICSILCLSGLFSFCLAQEDSSQIKLDSLFAHISPSAPGYMIGVMQNQKVLFAKRYGMANLEHSIPITAKSAFNIASLSKQFTAAAIALLILDGKVNLEDKVSTYLKDFPFSDSDMRIKHLIYMCSGIWS